MGLKATATAAIYIADVNESPICTASQVSIATNILAGVGEQIGSIDCYDTDIDTRNIELLYSITSGDPGKSRMLSKWNKFYLHPGNNSS